MCFQVPFKTIDRWKICKKKQIEIYRRHRAVVLFIYELMIRGSLVVYHTLPTRT